MGLAVHITPPPIFYPADPTLFLEKIVLPSGHCSVALSQIRCGVISELYALPLVCLSVIAPAPLSKFPDLQ